jgi:trimeric autotransporter adhesin
MCAYKVGGSGNDSMEGTTGVDSLYGMAGNDTLYGLGGQDVLDGGTGDDYILGAGRIDGGAGNDTMEGLVGQKATFYVGSEYDVVIASVLDWTGRSETVADFQAYGNKIVYESSTDSGQYYMPDNVQVAQITALSDVGVVGNEQSNYIYANGFSNYLDGAGGNDTIVGGGGILDILVGGFGNDSITGNGYLIGAEDNDTLNGTGALFGGDGDDLIIGGDGSDTILPGDGLDTMDGGGGGDTYLLTSADGIDRINDTGNSGRDNIESDGDVNLTAFSGIEDALVVDGGDYKLTGDGGNNALTGNINNNLMLGGLGADTLIGMAGNDTLRGDGGNDLLEGGEGRDSMDGGTGVDTMSGGVGDDVYVIDSASDVVTELAGEGRDTVRGFVSYTVPENIEVANASGTGIVNITARANASVYMNGNSAANVLTGSSQGDGLNGGTGNDTLIGGEGGDVYFIQEEGDVVVESATGSGVDAVVTLSSHTDLADNVEYLMMTGFADTANGSDTDNVILGSANDNVIDGRGGSDDISAGKGADILTGGLGDDTINGDTGNDTYLFAVGDGFDVIRDKDTLVGNSDTLNFGGVSTSQLWLTRQGNDLEIDVVGSFEGVLIENWYSGVNNQIEVIQAGGKTLTNSRVDALVSAMAGLAPPAIGQTTLPAAYQTQLAGALAQAWV